MLNFLRRRPKFQSRPAAPPVDHTGFYNLDLTLEQVTQCLRLLHNRQSIDELDFIAPIPAIHRKYVIEYSVLNFVQEIPGVGEVRIKEDLHGIAICQLFRKIGKDIVLPDGWEELPWFVVSDQPTKYVCNISMASGG